LFSAEAGRPVAGVSPAADTRAGLGSGHSGGRADRAGGSGGQHDDVCEAAAAATSRPGLAVSSPASALAVSATMPGRCRPGLHAAHGGEAEATPSSRKGDWHASVISLITHRGAGALGRSSCWLVRWACPHDTMSECGCDLGLNRRKRAQAIQEGLEGLSASIWLH